MHALSCQLHADGFCMSAQALEFTFPVFLNTLAELSLRDSVVQNAQVQHDHDHCMICKLQTDTTWDDQAIL